MPEHRKSPCLFSAISAIAHEALMEEAQGFPSVVGEIRQTERFVERESGVALAFG
jgi:hypothetical protein